uniref:BHLH domain-containing protein n=1 Tax=Oryza meridionalis TaxID=40149 RepID=A0A0E0CAQ6_9ORYZ
MAGAAPLRDSLRRLCTDVGWSYAVFWRATRAAGSQQLKLVWGDGHYERAAGAPSISGFEAMDLLLKEKAAALRSGTGRGGSGGGGEGHAADGAAGHGHDRVDALVHKAMAQQVHVVGEGVIGQAALTGLHRWIVHDIVDECEEEDEVLLEMKGQFCAGIQTIAVIPVLPRGVIQLGSTKMVMEEAAFIDHVRSLFQQLGSSTAVVPYGSFVQDSIMRTPFHKSLGVPTSSHSEDLAGGGNTYNDDMINHQFRHQKSPALTIQSFNPVQQFYAGPTFYRPVTIASGCDLFQPDHGSTFTLNSQSEDNRSTALLKNSVSHSKTSNDVFSHTFNPINEPNVSISGRRECVSIEQHGSCRNGEMEITIGCTASSSCTGKTNILNKVDALLSQDCLVDCQTSNATSVNRKFQTMSIVDNTKLQDEQAVKSLIGCVDDDFTGLITEADPDQLLDAIVSKIITGHKQNVDTSASCRCSQTQESYKSQIRLWVENNHSVGSDSLSTGQASDSLSTGQCKRSDEIGKSNRKRSRPGESARPRPKDRQMIQDRIKELREIVPNSAKCSIDALLEKTIKHMLFLQNVAKHADKLKESGEPKMLCKERGIFLEIADQIRGLGLTILKGVMEVRKDKIWARFAVEANKDVTRMEIFLSLVHLLEPSTGSSILSAGVENTSLPRDSFFPSSIPATGFSNCL